ncbi:unnamed protein product [Vitrella brassicaformis CCMP3155]|uniref:Uncharacterized protein n=2 Tax=Vitrella brassicaformis TaxID=1169539 RepID=A0A0G4GSN8_VITBC|nr:unnamed protein product [Vitrella brassicaformis CCMP3155]|mmetsp:Transcript_53574/g.134819  ORF Transcript_53574/g.134819 Transcript_53574/m.134819 type:complete len:230 (+) Transcript_53574:114-803(+)|eukprot:CEM33708.1 unnamed protein product [Vitrella brassicaformis CCMP3155]
MEPMDVSIRPASRALLALLVFLVVLPLHPVHAALCLSTQAPLEFVTIQMRRHLTGEIDLHDVFGDPIAHLELTMRRTHGQLSKVVIADPSYDRSMDRTESENEDDYDDELAFDDDTDTDDMAGDEWDEEVEEEGEGGEGEEEAQQEASDGHGADDDGVEESECEIQCHTWRAMHEALQEPTAERAMVRDGSLCSSLHTSLYCHAVNGRQMPAEMDSALFLHVDWDGWMT